MKTGKLPDGFTGEPGQCPFDALESGDQFVVYGYVGTCHNCGGSIMQDRIVVLYLRDVKDQHAFLALEDVPCRTCNKNIGIVLVLCGAKPVEITQEFAKIKPSE